MGRYDKITSYDIFKCNSKNIPDAIAYITGGPLAPNIRGQSLFYQLEDCVYIVTYISGIPSKLSSGEESSFHGFHIHSIGSCDIGDPQSPYLSSGGHYNPTNQPHPFHVGDLPPLFSNNQGDSGSAMLTFKTNRFRLEDIIGRSIIIHEEPDDFMTQPTGHSGKRWACGLIQKYCS